MSSFRVEENGDIAIVYIDQIDKKVNVLNTELIPEFLSVWKDIESNPSIKGAVLISGKDTGFIVGADLDMLKDVKTVEEGVALSKMGQQAMNRISNSKKPIVAAIHKECLGGGLELALACTARIVSNDPKTKLALPEVMLGLLPGAGGTRRLPDLIGLPDALDMMLTGRNIRPSKALKMGLVDNVVPNGQLLSKACELVRACIDGKFTRKSKNIQKSLMSFAMEKNRWGRKLVFDKAREKVMEQSKGLYPAPLKILEVVAADSDDAESQGFGELLCTHESKGLRHLFDCITECKKITGSTKKENSEAENENTAIQDTKYVGMIGAGLMGGGIATVLADKEIMVRLKDIDQKGIDAAMGYAHKYFGKGVKRKHMLQQEYDQRMERISGSTNYHGFGMMDVVIEAVPENLGLKQNILKDVEDMSDATKRSIVFASNTSSLPISEIAQNAKYPERVIGMHFFSPVEKMPLVEVIVTEKTDPQVTETIVKIARRMGKHVIVVNDCAGFYTTRILAPYLTEAMFLVLEGYAISDIDLAAQEAGFPVGPITLMDEVGIDVGAKVIEIMKQYYGERMEFPKSDAIDACIKDGRLGKKVSKGFYRYENGNSVLEDGAKVVDEDIYTYIKIPQKKDASTRLQRAEQISKRLLSAFVNEAAFCLEEGILRDTKSGDLGAVFGLGFPPFEGGPFRYMDKKGLKEIVEELRELSTKYGKRFQPAQILIDMEMGQQTFYS